jgi:hypothetical protein
MRNVDVLAGLAKGRRCHPICMGNRTIVVRLEQDEIYALPRMPLAKKSNGIEFVRWQVPLKLFFAGTVHRSQGMTLAQLTSARTAPIPDDII